MFPTGYIGVPLYIIDKYITNVSVSTTIYDTHVGSHLFLTEVCANDYHTSIHFIHVSVPYHAVANF